MSASMQPLLFVVSVLICNMQCYTYVRYYTAPPTYVCTAHVRTYVCTYHLHKCVELGMTMLRAFSHMHLCCASPRHVVIDHCTYVSHAVGRISLRLISTMTALSRRTRRRGLMLRLQGTTPRDSPSCTNVRACRHLRICVYALCVWAHLYLVNML